VPVDDPRLDQRPTSAPTEAGDRTLTAGPGPPRPAAYSGPTKIAGYRILRELGAGGMGAVFEALDEAMNRRVALKVMARSVSESGEAGNRFAREAWIAGRLNHPNLVRVFGRGEDGDVGFYSMELVDGGSLHDVVKSLRTWGKDEDRGLAFGSREYVNWALTRVIEAARGLEHAHRQGVVHRDIKPMNILLQRDPVLVKVADFGIAVDLTATRMTTAGAVMGTVVYMAPEQIRGQQDKVSPRTDVYALGVTLFELLTLELPYAGATQQLYMNAVLTTVARRPRKLNERVGRDLEIVMQKALQKEPADRYASAGPFADDLENILNFRPITARAPGPGSRTIKWVRRRPMHAVLLGVLVLAIPATGILGLRAVQHARLESRLRIEQWAERADHLIHDNRFREALDPLGKILTARPDDLDALRERALTYAQLASEEDDPKQRADLQEAALGDIRHVVDGIPDTRWPHRVEAFLLRSFGRDQTAQEAEDRAARLVSSAPEYGEVQIDAILAMRAGDDARAMAHLDTMIELRPDSADARLRRANVHERQREVQAAMTDYEVAAALKPSDMRARINLAHLKTVSGALDEGAALLEKVVAIDPDDATAHEGLSANLLAQGRAQVAAGDAAAAAAFFTKAETEARRALALDPGLAWAEVNLGVSLMERNRLLPAPDQALFAEAAGHYGKAIELTEEDHAGDRAEARLSALVNQCDALIQMKDLGRALQACRAVVELQPGNATSYYNLAGVHALSGRRDEALVALAKDVDLGDRDWQYLGADPWFASLRSDPGFLAILQRMKK
jgi:hypothetical protein